MQLAAAAAEQGFHVIAAAGGDGTVHEVANGLLQANIKRATLAVLPIGSANDYAWSLERQFGLSKLDDDDGATVDVGVVTAADGQETFFIESLGLGLSGQVTLEARRPSWLQGQALYALAVWRAVRKHRPTEFTIQFDDEPPERLPTLMASVMLGNREGSFLLAPDARLNDGLFEILHAAPMPRWRVLSLLPRVATAGLPTNHPAVTRRQCRSFTVQCTTPLVTHTDGEMLCTAADAIHSLSVRILPARLRVKVCSI